MTRSRAQLSGSAVSDVFRGARVGVVIPVYNEAAFVGEVVDTLPAFVDRAYVVDDCSTDDTWRVVQERQAAHATDTVVRQADGGRFGPSLVPIRHDSNRGRGAAVKTGYRAALGDGMDVVAVMDGDGQMDPDRLDDLVRPVADGVADYAKGNRLGAPEHRSEMTAWRRFGNRLLSVLTRVASGYWGTSDSQNGYTAISADTLEALDLEEVYDGYGFLNDMLVRLNVLDARVVEVPMPAIYGDEESGIEYRSFVPALSLLLAQLFAWRLTTKYTVGQLHPVAVLYGLGLGSGAFGLGYVTHWFAPLADEAGRLQLAFVILGTSATVTLVALALDRLHNRHLVTDGERP
ncbi:glycosyltransferase family 2 protein [Halosimplex salinum]|uniref:glycosyltransferase family 2 protein n=1 Tax=Halosimplex salinum TaxID=1710538 RepID=UPI001F2A81CF|nr:glycosyltransferase family 2 protein [Halosimplex salinum]